MVGLEEEPTPAGYVLHRIYAVEMSYRVRDTDLFADVEDSGLEIQWDWRIQDDRRFGVVFGVLLKPSRTNEHEITVKMVGEFELAGQGDPQPPIDDFSRIGATSIIYPFVREAIATLTMRSLVGEPLLLPPQNVHDLMEGIEFAKSTGAKQLGDFPSFSTSEGAKRAGQ